MISQIPPTAPSGEDEPKEPTKLPWRRPTLQVIPIAAGTQHSANTVSDGTGNLYS